MLLKSSGLVVDKDFPLCGYRFNSYVFFKGLKFGYYLGLINMSPFLNA
jgi:hypothetical protein